MLRHFALLAIGVAALSAQDKAIDVERSTITVHVGKAGIFSAAGHEHWVNAPISAGVLNDTDAPHVEFKVEAARLEVKPDPKVDPKTRATVQQDMQQKVLESSRYPEISFRSSRVEKQGDEWRVEGLLSLHGVTRPVAVAVTRSGEAYLARAVIRQTDFGIKPISAAGGTVKVKNELEIGFRIVARPK